MAISKDEANLCAVLQAKGDLRMVRNACSGLWWAGLILILARRKRGRFQGLARVVSAAVGRMNTTAARISLIRGAALHALGGDLWL